MKLLAIVTTLTAIGLALPSHAAQYDLPFKGQHFTDTEKVFTRDHAVTTSQQYGYDFGKIGVPGLTANVLYMKGDNIKAAGGDLKEWERDLTIGYVVPEGPLKNVGVMWKNAMWRNDIPGQRDQDENRLIVSYSIPLL